MIPRARSGASARIGQQQQAERLSAILTRTAEALERSAGLAGEHARRCADHRQTADAAKERRAAKHAQEAADRARAQAARWLKQSHELEERSRSDDRRPMPRTDGRPGGTRSVVDRSDDVIRHAHDVLEYAQETLSRLAAAGRVR